MAFILENDRNGIYPFRCQRYILGDRCAEIEFAFIKIPAVKYKAGLLGIRVRFGNRIPAEHGVLFGILSVIAVEGNDAFFDRVRHGDLVLNAADGDDHPFRGCEGLQSADDPLAVDLFGAEQGAVADLDFAGGAGQADFLQNGGQGYAFIAGKDILHLVVGKLHLIVGEAVRLRGSGRAFFLDIKFFGRQLAVFFRDVVNVRFQVPVGDLCGCE